MEINDNAILEGIERGRLRVRDHFTTDLNYDRIGLLRQVLQNWPFDLHERFVVLFAELWVVAEVARIANREPLIEYDQLYVFLAHSSAFFNSFKHR